jgi:glycosyltransferase involved in cell wall biosynthesis
MKGVYEKMNESKLICYSYGQTDLPYVSIGLPVYNGERFLTETLDSLLAQTFENLELIISDNASTDRTQEICKDYAVKDRRIRYYRNDQNLGAARNCNRVFELSTGKYFKWAAHDDLCAPQYLERCVEVLDHEPSVVLCYPRTVIINEHGEHIENWIDGFSLRSSKPYERYKRYHERLLSRPYCIPIFGVIRKNILRTTPLIEGCLELDRILLGEIALIGEFYEVPEHLFLRRFHPQMSTKANSNMQEAVAWLDPTNQGKILLPKWKWFFQYLSAIDRVQMKKHEKIRCYLETIRWAFSDRRRSMKRELMRAIKYFLLSCLRKKPSKGERMQK